MAAGTEDLSCTALASSKGIRIARKWRKPSFSPCRKAQSDQHSAVTVVRRQRWRSDIGPRQSLPVQQKWARTAGWLLLVLPEPGAGCCSLQLRFGRQGRPRKIEWHFRPALDFELCAPSLRPPIPVRLTTPMFQSNGLAGTSLADPGLRLFPTHGNRPAFIRPRRLSSTRRLACAGPHVQHESHSLRRKMHLPGSSSENRPCNLLFAVSRHQLPCLFPPMKLRCEPPIVKNVDRAANTRFWPGQFARLQR